LTENIQSFFIWPCIILLDSGDLGRGSIFLSALDSLVGKVAAHEGLLEGSEDFGELLDYDGITIKILGGFPRFLRGRGSLTKI
jgi:hypothetical protein